MGEGQKRKAEGLMPGGHARGPWPRAWDGSPEFLLPGSPEGMSPAGAAGKEQPFLRARSPPLPGLSRPCAGGCRP